jgi:trimeric autotransporter adhesin
MASHRRWGRLLVILSPVGLLILSSCAGFFVDPVLTGLTITPSTPSIAVGSTVQLTAIGTFDDGSRSTVTASFSTSNESIAKVTAGGLVTGIFQGTATITATSGVVSTTTTVTVTPANLVSIAVTPTNPSTTAGGAPVQFMATGTVSGGGTVDLTNAVTWKSSDITVATIDNTGKATPLKTGNTFITATSGSIVSPAVTLTVN